MCQPMESDSLNVTCTLNGKNVNCSKPSIPGTKLSAICQTAYNLPNEEVESPAELTCLSDGKWSGLLCRCVPSNFVFLFNTN